MNPNLDIEPGDLVALVRGHECTVNAVGGIPFRVAQVHCLSIAGVRFVCRHCGYGQSANGVRFTCDTRGNNLPLAWLKKFPPLDEADSTERDKRKREPVRVTS